MAQHDMRPDTGPAGDPAGHLKAGHEGPSDLQQQGGAGKESQAVTSRLEIIRQLVQANVHPQSIEFVSSLRGKRF